MTPEIIVRPVDFADLPRINEMHQAQGLGYDAPNWRKMLCSAVIEVDGKVEMGAFLRKTAETYLVFDPKDCPFGDKSHIKRGRIAQIVMLHRELLQPCLREGLTDIHTWLKPELDRDFGRVLGHFGWTKAPWVSYSREVK